MVQAKKFEMEGYSISIVGKNVQITDTIRDHVFEKISKFEKFTNKILDLTITLDVQKLEQSAVFLMKFLHFQIKSHASTESLYSAIDKASDRMLRLISKYKTQLMDHQAKGLSVIDLNVNVLQPQRDELQEINTEIEAETWAKEQERYTIHKIVAKEKIPLRKLRQDEAIMKMELSSDPFLIYQGEEDQKLKVIYRREDQNFGIVEIQ